MGVLGWFAFLAGLGLLLCADLFIFHRTPHRVSTHEAAISSTVWIALGLGFSIVVALTLGPTAAQHYVAGYLVEKSLSVDNLFVFIVLFRFFGVPEEYRHRVLFYGIIGAYVFRGAFIAVGGALLEHFSWIAFVFSAVLFVTALKLLRGGLDHGAHPERNPVLRLARRFLPMTASYRGAGFVVREEGRIRATPLLAALIAVETTDIVFALDSIPAIFGITRVPFIVFSSNALALLGLRSLYFLLSGLVQRMQYLRFGIAVILALIALKFLYEETVHLHEIGRWAFLPKGALTHVPPWGTLPIIAAILVLTFVASILADRRAR